MVTRLSELLNEYILKNHGSKTAGVKALCARVEKLSQGRIKVSEHLVYKILLGYTRTKSYNIFWLARAAGASIDLAKRIALEPPTASPENDQ